MSEHGEPRSSGREPEGPPSRRAPSAPWERGVGRQPGGPGMPPGRPQPRQGQPGQPQPRPEQPAHPQPRPGQPGHPQLRPGQPGQPQPRQGQPGRPQPRPGPPPGQPSGPPSGPGYPAPEPPIMRRPAGVPPRPQPPQRPESQHPERPRPEPQRPEPQRPRHAAHGQVPPEERYHWGHVTPPPQRPVQPQRYPTPPSDRQPLPRTTVVKTAEQAESSNARLVKESGSIAFATLISRITGFGKQLLLLTVLGPAIASAYTVAATIPTMISELLVGAVLTAIVVPTLVRAEKEDPDGGAAFVRRLYTAALTVLGIGTLLVTAAAPVLVTHVFLSDDGEVNVALTTALTFLLLPAIVFYGMTALLTAILNTHQVFKPGAWAPVLNNVVVLVVLVLYAVTPGEITLDPVRMGEPKLLLLGLGVTIGVIVQAMSLLPAIRREGISLRPLWGVDDRLKMFAGMGAAIILYVLISQAGWVIATRISSHVDAAGPAIYQNAWLLLQLPYGVLGVTVLTAIMPRLSRNAAADDTPAVVDDLGAATRLTMIALLPVVVFMTLAGPQIGQALYGYGNFGGDARRLGEAVAWSAFTLIPYALVLIHLRVFYAREQAWTPTWIILGITTVKVVFSAIMPMVLGPDQVVVGLSLANGLGFVAGAVIGGFLLHRSLGDLRMTNVGRTITRVLLASLAGGAVMWIVDQVLGLHRLTDSFGGLGSLVRVGLTAIVMFAVAFGLMRLAGIPEIVAITVAISRRLGFAPPAPDLDLEGPADGVDATMVLPMADLRAAPYYYRYDPYLDAQTMVLPVVRPEAVDNTGKGQFPYPVPERNATAGSGVRGETGSGTRAVSGGDARAASEADDRAVGDPIQERTSTFYGEGGTRVSDDAAGGAPAAESATAAGGGLSTDVPPGSQTGAAPERAEAADTADAPAQQERQADSGHEAPADPTQTGVMPMPPLRVEAPSKRVQRGPKLIAGASVAGGRYRLLAGHGGARGLRFWQALDVKLDREVALTFVDADQKAADNSGHDGPQAILSRTLRLGRINSPGLARVLDVVRGSSGGIVVAEWTPGRSLREMAETQPSPIGAARAIRALAAAAELAHRGGGSLSIDHPDRIRISASGDAVLAFPGTLADSDAQSDVRGLGAMLYALTVARWPIRTGGMTGSAATVGGLRLADFGPDGTPVEPRQIRPEVPFEISAVAVRSLESNKGVRTAATVQHVLEQASVVDQKTDFIPVLRLGQRAPSAPDETLADPELLAAEKERSQRMMWILVGLGVLAALVVGVVIWWLLSIFAPGASDQPLNEQRNIGLTTATSAPAVPGGPAPEPTPAAPTGGVPMPITGVSVYSPEGTPDNIGGVSAVLDNDPATFWRTDQYFQQFPALKNGVGVLATLGSPGKLTKVVIDSQTPGTMVEIRSSPTAAPTLDQTQLIGSATLGEGVTEIPVSSEQSTRYVLIWITALGNNGGQYQSSLSEVHFEAAP
ncbi:murein biosynthesis integral membrane protein MurJ [Nocardia otitidiscaviarum]|uniref:Murein biosynthesis integral membrane protein MurJ n=2 Tax=Nocardia otitidiscaviarum TaxID=1823 RepID=A0A516NUL1_9NOCA|nr:murein biosynthesis integral membrane protein MurJ [Nocardia otitidiscaviarum]